MDPGTKRDTGDGRSGRGTCRGRRKGRDRVTKRVRGGTDGGPRVQTLSPSSLSGVGVSGPTLRECPVANGPVAVVGLSPVVRHVPWAPRPARLGVPDETQDVHLTVDPETGPRHPLTGGLVALTTPGWDVSHPFPLSRTPRSPKVGTGHGYRTLQTSVWRTVGKVRRVVDQVDSLENSIFGIFVYCPRHSDRHFRTHVLLLSL